MSSQGSAPLYLLLSVSAVLLLLLSYSPGQRSVEVRRQRRDNPDYTGARSEEQTPHEDQDSTEFPAEHLDPAAIDLTPLVNTLINSSQSGSSQLFSLLSVTSYSSMALHKLTLLVYNISSIKTIESGMFRRRFCYCVTNETNDLTDFTAILLDVMGNSSSYLHELFKSSSILSVSQRNNSDCIYICVMAGQLGREPPELWALDSITPLFNQTIVEGPHTVRNLSAARPPVPVGEWTSGSLNRSLMSPPVSRVHSTAHVSPSSQAQESEDHRAPQPIPTTSPKHSGTTTGYPSTTVHHQLSTSEESKPVPTTTPPLPVSSPTRVSTPLLSPVSISVHSPTPMSPRLSTLTRSPVPISFTPQSSVPTRDSAEVTLAQMLRTTQSPAVGDTTLDRSRTTILQPVSTHPQRTTVDPRRTTTPPRLITTEQPGCPWRRSELEVSTVKLSTHKLQPCVFELCKFYSQCLCRSFRAKRPKKRYCLDSHLWYQKHTVEVCRRVRRLSFSRNLKQRCLSKMCDKL